MWIYFFMLYASVFLIIITRNINISKPQSKLIIRSSNRCKLTEFRLQLHQKKWQLFMINHKSFNLFNHNNTCDFCNTICYVFSASFNVKSRFSCNRIGSQKHLCKDCLSQCLPSLLSLETHLDRLLDSRDLRQIQPVDIQILIQLGILNINLKPAIYQYLCQETTRCIRGNHPLPQVLLEDWIMANLNLLSFDSRTLPLVRYQLQQQYRQFGLDACLCGRPLDKLVNSHYCSECSDQLDLIKPSYLPLSIYLMPLQRRKLIDSSHTSNYLSHQIEKLSNYENCKDQWECSVCRESSSYRFRFGCGHFICQMCHLQIKYASIDQSQHYLQLSQGILIKCPFCRDPYVVLSPAMDRMKLKLGQEIMYNLSRAFAKSEQLPIDRRHHYQSQTMLREMMKYHNRPVWDYLIRLENDHRLGWCQSYPFGLLKFRSPDVFQYQSEVKACLGCSQWFSTQCSWNVRCHQCWTRLKKNG
jgi:hypothetical protein